MIKLYKIRLDVSELNKDNPLLSNFFKVDESEYRPLGDYKNHQEYMQMLKSFINNITNKNIDTNHFNNNVNSLYRFPKISLSRDKLSIYQEKTNFKISRDKDKSDICVISNKFLESQISEDWAYSINITYLLKCLKDALIVQPNDDKLKEYIQLFSNQSKDTIILINRTYGWHENKIKSRVHNFIESTWKNMTDSKYIKNSNTYYFNNPEMFDWLQANKHKLIMDTQLNKLCTEDSVTLKVSDWETISNLLRSSDSDNVTVGMSLMANCNLEESRTILAMLFTFTSDYMKGHGSKMWNQINFKSLKKEFTDYIDVQPNSWAWGYDRVIKQLSKDGILNSWAVKEVVKKLHENVLGNNFGVTATSSAFTIDLDAIKIKEEYKKTLVETPEETFENVL